MPETNFPDGISAAVDGVTIGTFTETIARSSFTDGGAAAGTAVLTNSLPAGAVVLACYATSVTGFAGNTSATITVGDGTDADRYMTGTPSVFTTAATGLDLGVPSGARYHGAAMSTITVTVTGNSDFTSISAGSVTLKFLYLV